MPVNNKRPARKARKQTTSQKKKTISRNTKANARKSALRKSLTRKSAAKPRTKIVVQRETEPVAVPEPEVEIIEVVETEMYEEPLVLTEEEELS